MSHRRTTIPLSGAGLDLGASSSGGGDAEGPADALGVADATRYELGGVVGSGGMGEVLVAWDKRLGRQVAYKRPRVGAGEALVREAGIAARLHHPGIVPVYDAGLDPRGRPFYTMPLLAGHDLGWHIEHAPDLSARLRFVRTVLSAAEAVAHAHDTGVVHRDLKPHNIMLGEHGEVRVADWGLAGRAGEPSPEGLGTPGYAPTEQVRGGALDGRADVHALGATLWHVLVGAPPPTPVPPVADFEPDAPAELCAVVARATGPLGERYRDAGALAADLTAWFEGRRVGAYHYTPGAELRRLARRFRLPLTVAAVGAAAFVVAVGVGWWRTAVAAEDARVAAEAAQQAEQRAQVGLALALVGRAITATERGDRAEAELYAASALRLRESPRARGVLARYAGLPRPIQLDRVPTPGCSDVAVDASGRWFACTVHGEGVAWGDERLTRRAAGGINAQVLAFDGATNRLYAGDDAQRVWRIDEDLPELVTTVFATDAMLATRPAGPPIINVLGRLRTLQEGADPLAGWSPCADGLAMTAFGVGADGAVAGGCQDFVTLTFAEALGADARWSVARDPAWRSPAAVAVGPERVFVANFAGGMEVYARADGAAVAAWDIPGAVLRRLVVGDDRVAGLGTDGGVVVWTLDGAELGRLPVQADALAWRGEELVTFGREAIERWILPRGSRPQVIDAGEGIAGVAVDAAGGRVAVAQGDGVVRSFDLLDGRLLWARKVGGGVVKDVAYAPDGGRVAAVSSRRRGVDLLDAATGAPLDLLEGSGHRRVTWLQDGTLVTAPYEAGIARWWPDGRADVVGLEAGRGRDLERALAGDAAVMLGSRGDVWRVTATDAAFVRALPDALAVAWGDHGLLWTDGLRLLREGGEVSLGEVRAVDLDAGPGGVVAVGALDGQLLLFTEDGAALRAELLAHDDRVAAVAFSPDGQWLVTGGWDGRVRVWSLLALDADPVAMVDELERAWGRTAEELLAR